MSFFDRLFGKKPPSAPAPAPAPVPPAAPAPETPAAPATIKAFDEFGRLLQIPREHWRTKFLPDSFRKHWNDASELARVVGAALTDGFIEEAIEPARQLLRIDAVPHRGATLLGAALVHSKRFAEAADVLSADLEKNGPDGTVLTNLAKAQSGLGRKAVAEKTLWSALEAEPNHGNALIWYAAIARERGGEAAELEAYRRVAALPGSWRAQLGMARSALKKGDPASNLAALAIHREVLGRLEVLPADAFVQISGDLCNAGLLKEALALCTPRFVAEQHGLAAGNNLVRAFVAQKDAASARRVLDQLYRVSRPDWREHLRQLERAVVEIEHRFGPVAESVALEVAMLTLERPIWAGEGDAFVRLLPKKRDDAPRIAIVAGSARTAESEVSKVPIGKPSDAIGGMSRGIPMFLAEQVHLCADAKVTFLIPWLKRGGFVLSSRPWNVDALAAMGSKPDFAVFVHFEAVQEPWQARLTLTRVIDDAVLASWVQVLRREDVATTLGETLDRLLRELQTHADVAPSSPPAWLAVPDAAHLAAYAAGLEKALAVGCASQVPLNRPFLYGEREILDALLDLSLRQPANALARLVFLATIERESRLRSAVAAEYRTRVEKLQNRHPLPKPADELAKELLGRVVWE